MPHQSNPGHHSFRESITQVLVGLVEDNHLVEASLDPADPVGAYKEEPQGVILVEQWRPQVDDRPEPGLSNSSKSSPRSLET